MSRRAIALTSVVVATGCFSHASVPSDQVAVAVAMCGGGATAQPHPRVIRDDRGRTRILDGTPNDKGFIVDHKTQMRWNNEWVHVCYSGYDVRQVPEHDLRRPDLGRAVGAGVGVGLSAALILVPILLLSLL